MSVGSPVQRETTGACLIWGRMLILPDEFDYRGFIKFISVQVALNPLMFDNRLYVL